MPRSDFSAGGKRIYKNNPYVMVEKLNASIDHKGNVCS